MVTGMLGRFGQKGKPRKLKGEKNRMLRTCFENQIKAVASLNCFENRSFPADSKPPDKRKPGQKLELYF